MTISSINQNKSPHWYKVFNTIPLGVKKVFETAKKILNSPTFWVTLSGSATLASIIIPLTLTNPVGFVITALLVMITANIFFKYSKKIVYEMSLWYRLLLNKICNKENYKWFHKIDNNVYLGAIPLKEKDSLDNLKEEGITSILSLIEDFEYEKTPITTPISKDDWIKEGFNHYQIQTKDMKPLQLTDIINAVNFIKKEVKSGKKVYVHCKAGVGRSATAVCCYFLEKYNLTPQDAVTLVRAKRPIIKIQKYQFEKIVDYYNYLQKKKGNYLSDLKKYIPGW